MIEEDELALIREDVTATMGEECVITRSGARGAFNTTTGVYADTADSTIYQGACRVAQMSEQDRLVTFGDQEVGLVAYVLSLPFDAPALQKDDVVTFTTTHDEELLTKTLEVHSVKFGGINAKRKVILEERR